MGKGFGDDPGEHYNVKGPHRLAVMAKHLWELLMKAISYAYGKNHWELDPDLKAVLGSYWPDMTSCAPGLRRFGALAGKRIYETAYHVDHEARPVLVMHDLDGRRVDRVRLSPAHEALLKDLSFINRPPYEGGSWHHHFALGYMLADPGLYCILTITNQTVFAIQKYAPEHRDWSARLLAGVGWGATWMTESQGGSDLGANTTRAAQKGEGWRLEGEKYFSSGAGLTDLALVSARPDGAPGGPKGLALFLVPRLNSKGELNFQVRRLKDKSATRSVPSGEVEFHGAEAFLVGEPDQGIYYILENLNLSRLANAVAAMGIARKSHFETAFRVQRRRAFGRSLHAHPLVARDLTDMAVRMAGGTALAFHAVQAFSAAAEERPPYSPAYHYARFLTHLAKNRTAGHASVVTQLAMELFGGIGFLEEYAVARWHREALITPIWEGPSNIQALDMLEALHKKKTHEPFLEEFTPLLEMAGPTRAARGLHLLETAVTRLRSSKPEEAQWEAKAALTEMADVAQSALLWSLAQREGGRYEKLAELYTARFVENRGYPSWALGERDVWLPEALREPDGSP